MWILTAFVGVCSAIEISVKAGDDVDSSSIQVKGSELHIIGEDERSTWSVSDSQVKDAVNKYFGKR